MIELPTASYSPISKKNSSTTMLQKGSIWPGNGSTEMYLLSVIQRDLKVVGRFYYLDIVKGKAAYKKFIPPTVHRLKRNFVRLPQTERLVPILAEHYEELR